ncbi:MAG TPA: zinc finger, RING-type domain-containing protein [Archangium sp.]|uniref:RING finger protein n=1 Tax=Archangium sp. TaxID=1872627 RepID=UPI002E31F1BC|nr:zinc finger, RING-type domain-containing protein [Archangium sp.]HEX5752981.1 zinc finger, RING-type domain-containing protein [Archangium sp.]
MREMRTRAVPDPLAFAARALARRGALLEEEEGHEVLALLPPELSRELGLTEEVRLSAAGEGGTVACGLGTPLLEAVVGEARREVPVAGARLVREPAPRVGHARNLAGRYVIRNGVAEVLEAAGGEATYLVAWLAYVAEADERHEGVGVLGVYPRDGARPGEGFLATCDVEAEGALAPWPRPAVEPGAEQWLARYAPEVEERVLRGVREATARRHARDRERMSEYYAAMVAEARAPRRRVDADAMEAKVRHLLAERDSKLRDLAERFTLRVHTRLAAALWVAAPVARVRVRVRRRKGERELVLRLPAGAHGFDWLPCEGCPGTTERPALCDERLHVLCETCVPLASGRPRCPACGA